MEKLAIIKEIGFGNRDMPSPGLWFTVYIDEHNAALLCFTGQEALDMVRRSDVHEVHNLDGKPCWVWCEGGQISFLRFWEEKKGKA